MSRKLCGCNVGVMWVMQQLSRRAGATDFDLYRIGPGRRRCRRLLKGWMRKNMVNVRGPRRAGWPDLTAFHMLSTG